MFLCVCCFWFLYREYVFDTASRSFTKTEKDPNVKLNGEAHNLGVSRSVTNVLSLQVIGVFISYLFYMLYQICY